MASAVSPGPRDLLPTNVTPRHYEVTLEPDLVKFTFEGSVIIHLDVVEDSTAISLHTLDLDLHKVEVACDGKNVG